MNRYLQIPRVLQDIVPHCAAAKKMTTTAADKHRDTSRQVQLKSSAAGSLSFSLRKPSPLLLTRSTLQLQPTPCAIVCF